MILHLPLSCLPAGLGFTSTFLNMSLTHFNFGSTKNSSLLFEYEVLEISLCARKAEKLTCPLRELISLCSSKREWEVHLQEQYAKEPKFSLQSEKYTYNIQKNHNFIYNLQKSSTLMYVLWLENCIALPYNKYLGLTLFDGKCAAPQWKLLNSADLSDSMISSVCALILAPLVASNLFRDAQACSLSTLCCLCCCLTAVSWSPQWLEGLM